MIRTTMGFILFLASALPAAATDWTTVTQNYGALGGGSYCVPAAADFDDDGDVDFVIGDYSGTVRYFRNQGTAWQAAFAAVPESVGTVASSRTAVTAADMDGDGDLDLLAGQYYGSVAYFRNEGTRYAPHWTYAGVLQAGGSGIDVGYNAAPCVYDMDGDGDPDLLVGDRYGGIDYYRNDGTVINPYWTAAASPFAGITFNGYTVPVLYDIDGDDDPDLFAGNDDGTIEYYRNDDTSWTLIDANYFMIDAGSYSAPAFADMDGDGDAELFIGTSSGNLAYYPNRGTAGAPYYGLETAWYGRLGGTTGNVVPQAADLNGDGALDLVVGGTSGLLTLYLNTGTAANPVWTVADDTLAGEAAGGLAHPWLGDADGDGDADLVVGRSDGTIGYYRNDGTPAAAVWTAYDSLFAGLDVGSEARPAMADLDNDGDMDLLCGSSGTGCSYYRHDDTGSGAFFTQVAGVLSGITVSRCVPRAADMDGDGDPDLVCGDSYGTVSLYLNTGTPDSAAFLLATSSYAGTDVGSYCAPLFIDLDDDGDRDLLLGGYSGVLTYVRNDGGGTELYWHQRTVSYGGFDVGSYSAPAFCDIDADGDPDLFAGSSDGTIALYRNYGTADAPACTLDTSAYAYPYNASVQYSVPAFADIDADGDPDLFVGKADGGMLLYRNDGTAATAAWTLFDDMYFNIDVGSNCAPAFCDIDADGDLDLFTGDYNGYVGFYRNQGSASGPYWSLVSSSYLSIDVGYRSVPVLFDIDADGDYDLFIGDDDGEVWQYRNDGTAQEPDFTYVTGTFNAIDAGSYAAPAFCDIDADGRPDLFVGNYGGTLYHWEALNALSGVRDGCRAPGALPVRTPAMPCRGTAGFTLRLDAPADVDVRLFASDGREAVRTTRRLPAGVRTVTLDVRGLGAGVYPYRIDVGGASATGRLVIAP